MRRLACTALLALTTLVAILCPTKSPANITNESAVLEFSCPNTGRAQWVKTPYPNSVAGTGQYLNVVGGPGECGYLFFFVPVPLNKFDSLDFYATSASALKTINFTLDFYDHRHTKEVELTLRGGREVDITDQGTPVFHMRTAMHYANLAPWKDYTLVGARVEFDNTDPSQSAQFGNLELTCIEPSGRLITYAPGQILLATYICDGTF